MLNGHILSAVNLDPDLSAGYGDVLDRDVIRRDDDSSAHDRARFTHELLRMIDHERALVNSRRQVNRRRLCRPRDSPRGSEERSDGRNGRWAGGSELSPILTVGESRQWEGGVHENL